MRKIYHFMASFPKDKFDETKVEVIMEDLMSLIRELRENRPLGNHSLAEKFFSKLDEDELLKIEGYGVSGRRPKVGEESYLNLTLFIKGDLSDEAEKQFADFLYLLGANQVESNGKMFQILIPYNSVRKKIVEIVDEEIKPTVLARGLKRP